jgi:RNA polymerase sigma-70 factor (ECF subfamily)
MEAATDQALVARVLDGDDSAFAELYHRHQPVLSRRVYRVLGHLPDVEDVLQVTFVEAYRSLPRYQPDRPFAPWLSGIAFRQVASHLRRARRRAWLRFGEEADPIDRSVVSSEERAIQRQLLALLYQALDSLPAKKRIAFSLHALEGLGFTEIGEMVGASPQTVRARVLSARKKILERFQRATQLGIELGLLEGTG